MVADWTLREGRSLQRDATLCGCGPDAFHVTTQRWGPAFYLEEYTAPAVRPILQLDVRWDPMVMSDRARGGVESPVSRVRGQGLGVVPCCTTARPAYYGLLVSVAAEEPDMASRGYPK